MSIKYFTILIATFLCVTGCFPSPKYEVELSEKISSDIPARGGHYSFDVAMIRTRIHVEGIYQAFEYRISFDGLVAEQYIVNNWSPSTANQYPNVEMITDDRNNQCLRVWFDIPENQSTENRRITVEVLIAKDFTYYEEHVDAGDNLWTIVWEGTQAGV